jgi:hypothetical protein
MAGSEEVPLASSHRQRGFCFAEFSTHEAAHSALKSLSRTPCPLPELLEAEGGSLKVDWCVAHSFFSRSALAPSPSSLRLPLHPPPPPPTTPPPPSQG